MSIAPRPKPAATRKKAAEMLGVSVATLYRKLAEEDGAGKSFSTEFQNKHSLNCRPANCRQRV